MGIKIEGTERPETSFSPRRRQLLAGLASAVAAGSVGAEQTYPSRQIVLVVPYAAGGGPDANARMVADGLGRRLGTNIVVQNRAGASGTIGATQVAHAKPDGYTLLYGTAANLAAAPSLFRALPYDPVRDFTSVCIMLESHFALMVKPELASANFHELLETIRKAPKDNPVGGSSATGDLLNTMLSDRASLSHTYVPYKESSMMMNDLLGGRLTAAWNPMSGARQYLSTGTARVVAVASSRRLPAFPDIPTIAETYPDVVLGSWNGIFVPAGTPSRIVDVLHGHVIDIVRSPAFVKLAAEAGMALSLTPAESQAYLEADTAKWRELALAAKLQPG
jgi:tripartite-type tricarboxylate transporter receptor subunit TctC